MKHTVKFLLLFCLLVSQHIGAKEPFTDIFKGEWCGKWDNTYELCITIESHPTLAKNNQNHPAIARYKWKERVNGKFRKAKKIITPFNKHTLKLENIWFTVDKENLQQANATGMFTSQTRKAVLTKTQ